MQDWGSNGAVRALNFDAFVSFLNAHGQNFTLLWCTELPKFRSLPTTESSPPDFTVSPFPWLRIGPGLATDGGLKFNLTKFDPAYFDRLRARVQALSSTGIYVGVYLFSGEFLLRFRCSTDGYSRKLNLANVAPSSTLCSTHYCLAQTPSVGAEYLAYAPSGGTFTMDLSAMPDSRKLAVEWFNPASGETLSQNSIPAGSSARSFSAPFMGDAVLYLVDSEGHK